MEPPAQLFDPTFLQLYCIKCLQQFDPKVRKPLARLETCDHLLCEACHKVVWTSGFKVFDCPLKLVDRGQIRFHKGLERPDLLEGKEIKKVLEAADKLAKTNNQKCSHKMTVDQVCLSRLTESQSAKENPCSASWGPSIFCTNNKKIYTGKVITKLSQFLTDLKIKPIKFYDIKQCVIEIMELLEKEKTIFYENK